MKIIISAIFAILLFTGCSHKISINPVLDNIRNINVENKIDANVGYYISTDNRNKIVNTLAGGGDRIEYTPYNDLEGSLNTILSKVFNRVYSLKSMEDKEYINMKKIEYIFTYKIKTDSSSVDIMIWPPTEFTIELTCKAVNINGDEIWKETVNSLGNANSLELMKDHSLSAQRATEDAFIIMLHKLQQTDKFNTHKGI